MQNVSPIKDRLENVRTPTGLLVYLLTTAPQWEATQDSLKLNMQRNVYGIHAPMRHLMERKIVGFVSPARAPISSLY